MIDKYKLKESNTFCMLSYAHLWQCRWRHGPCCEAQEELNNPAKLLLKVGTMITIKNLDKH